MIGSLACCASPAAAVAHNCATNIGAAQATPSRLSYSQNMRRPAPAAPRPARNQHRVRPLQPPHRPPARVPPPAQHPAARRARQLPARQLPLDCIPVTVYREHDASARHPRPSRLAAKRINGRALPIRRAHRAGTNKKGQPLRAAPATSATSVTQTRACAVILSGRRNPLIGEVPPPTNTHPQAARHPPHRDP